MKCEYQIRYETRRRQAKPEPVSHSLRPQLVQAGQAVVDTYKQYVGGDSEKEEQIVKALMTRSSKLNNVRVCCAKMDRSVGGKDGFERVDTTEFSTSIDNVQITTTGTGIEDAMQHLMAEASMSLAAKAREKIRESGLDERQVSVEVKSITMDIEVPVGLPPDGACIALA